MLEIIDCRKIAKDNGCYDIPVVEEQRMKSRVIGKMCLDSDSIFCDSTKDQFLSKASEIIQKRFPNSKISVEEQATEDKRCATYVVTSIDSSDVSKVSNLTVLTKQGFKDLGGGLYKKGNELWSLKVDNEGDYNIVRSESEPLFGTDTEEQEVIVSQRVKDGEIEVMSNKEVREQGYFIDEEHGHIVNSDRDHIGKLLFIIEAEKKTAAWWEGRKFKHPDTGHMVLFYSLPPEEQRKLNQQVKERQAPEKKAPEKKAPEKAPQQDLEKSMKAWQSNEMLDIEEYNTPEELVEAVEFIADQPGVSDAQSNKLRDQVKILKSMPQDSFDKIKNNILKAPQQDLEKSMKAFDALGSIFSPETLDSMKTKDITLKKIDRSIKRNTKERENADPIHYKNYDKVINNLKEIKKNLAFVSDEDWEKAYKDFSG